MHRPDRKEECIHAKDESGDELSRRFEIRKEIGRGGYSVVYSALDRILDREVALKVLKVETGAEGEQQKSERFRKEARASSALRHPNIVQMYSFGWGRNEAFIAMELLNGKTLEQILQTEPILNRERFEEIFIPVMDALIYAHSLQLIHRDIKPANIMTTIENEKAIVKVLDFGLAKSLEPAVNGSQAQSATVHGAGTPFYMSPEQCAGTKCDARSDIYSLACVMYETLAGTAPFLGATAAETMYMHLGHPIPQLDQISGSRRIPVALVEAVLSGLAKKAEQRPTDMVEFKSMILKGLNSETIANRKMPHRVHALLAVACLVIAILSILVQASKVAHDKKLATKRELSEIKPKIVRAPDVLLAYASNARLKNDFSKSLEYLTELRDGLTKHSTNQEISECYFDLAQTEMWLSKVSLPEFSEAERKAKRELALQYLNKVEKYNDGNYVAIPEVTQLMGQALISLNRNQEAIAYFKKIQNQLVDAPPQEMARFYYHFGCCLQDIKRNRESLNYLERSLKIFDTLEDGRTSVTATLATVRYCSTAFFLKETHKANRELNRTKDQLLHRDFKSESCPEALAEMSKFLKSRGNVAEAEKFAQRSLIAGEESKKPQQEIFNNDAGVLKLNLPDQ